MPTILGTVALVASIAFADSWPLGVAGLALVAVGLVIEHRERLAQAAVAKLDDAVRAEIDARLAPIQADVGNLKTKLNLEHLG